MDFLDFSTKLGFGLL